MKILIIFAMFTLTATACFALGLWVASAVDNAFAESKCKSTEKINEIKDKQIKTMREHLRILGAVGYDN